MTVKLGWLHFENGRYRQVRLISGGGTRDLLVSHSDDLTKEKLLRLAKDTFFPNGIGKKGMIWADLETAIGDFETNIIHKFSDANGKEVDYFHYLKARGLRPSRAPLYLMTKLKPRTPLIQTDESFPITSSDSGVQLCSDFVTSFNHKLLAFHDGRQLCDPNCEIELQFMKTTNCAYSNKTSTVMFWDVISCYNWENHISTFDDFNPLQEGFTLFKIRKNDVTYFSLISSDETGNQSEVLKSTDQNYKLICSDKIVGYNSGKLCLGVTCSQDITAAFFTWMLGESVFDEGFGRCLVFPKQEGIYKCVVTYNSIREESESIEFKKHCSDIISDNATSDRERLIMGDQISECGIESDCIKIAIIKAQKSEIMFGRQIGQGSFGTVYKGFWASTEVAIKEIKIKRLKMLQCVIDSELKVAACIRHPFVCQFMAYAVESNALFLITELISGNNLEDVLFDEKVRKEFSLSSSDKINISRNCSSAVSYLHSINPMVIH